MNDTLPESLSQLRQLPEADRQLLVADYLWSRLIDLRLHSQALGNIAIERYPELRSAINRSVPTGSIGASSLAPEILPEYWLAVTGRALWLDEAECVREAFAHHLGVRRLADYRGAVATFFADSWLSDFDEGLSATSPIPFRDWDPDPFAGVVLPPTAPRLHVNFEIDQIPNAGASYSSASAELATVRHPGGRPQVTIDLDLMDRLYLEMIEESREEEFEIPGHKVRRPKKLELFQRYQDHTGLPVRDSTVSRRYQNANRIPPWQQSMLTLPEMP